MAPTNPENHLLHKLTNGQVICTACANTVPYLVAADAVHWEGKPVPCEHCGNVTEAVYGDAIDVPAIPFQSTAA